MPINMSNLDISKKPAPKDWHRADIKASLEKRGLSLARLARLHGYGRSSPALALRLPWPKMERLIAAAIGVRPQEIWPSRYHEDGTPKSGRGERGIGRWARDRKNTTVASDGNVEVTRGDRHEAPTRRTHG